MGQRILIFTDKSTGHHYEYIKILYNNAIHDSGNFYYFLLPLSFRVKFYDSFLSPFYNIQIGFLPEKFEPVYSKLNIIGKSIYLNYVLKKHIRNNKIDHLLMLSIMILLPFFPIFFRRGVKVSGIIYLIYLYRWKNSSLLLKCLDVLKYIILTRSLVVRNIFLINGIGVDNYLNKLFKTTKFSSLVDPISISSSEEISSLREQMGIERKTIVCAHFGYLSHRKGTIEILEALNLMDVESLDKFHFIFAGEVDGEIYLDFHMLLNKLKQFVKITYLEGFVDFRVIESICKSSDFLLIPYLNSYQSSGVLGYSAQFNVPVIGPKNGLLGKLIKRYKLGICLSDVGRSSLKECFDVLEKKRFYHGSEYISDNSMHQFLEKINLKINE